MPQSLSKVIIHIIFSTKGRSAMVERLKKASSKWIKGLDSKYRQFYWQRGYGAFSVSPSQLNAVVEYVEHHRTRSFQEEYRDFLRKYGVEFDQRYVWD